MFAHYIYKVYDFYAEGFRSMKLGKLLWCIILLKLFILFFVLKLFFFPDYLGKYEGEQAKQDYVSSELIQRANSNLKNQ